jgi:glutathione peroxidase
MAESNAHGFSFSTIEGAPLPLDRFRGKPVLVVNTASFCGYTPQYTDLETLHQRYAGRGLIVLGVPSNDFGAQEPGTATEIKQFCSMNYHVTFPLAAKEHVLGPEAHPLYRWNFHKYLIAPDGSLAGAWPSAVKPLAPEIVEEIERLL